MAALNLSQTRKKRKRKDEINNNINQKKLLDGEHVEVRSTEEGFVGSWHAATVMDSSNDSVRNVKYEHILNDNGIGLLTEDIRVSPIIDGDVIPIIPVNYRGNMRPLVDRLPPEFEFDVYGLNYGLCVDVYDRDAWWEGVIFDHEDGGEERLVFFPDLGDEQKVEVGNMRVTYDWDEVSEEWRLRGDWLFLELIEEHGVEMFVSVSVRQLWYDLRAKKGFKTRIKEWTSWVRTDWDKLVLEVIQDNLKLTAAHFLTVMEREDVVKCIDVPTRTTRNSGYNDDTEDILEDCVNEHGGPSARTRSCIGHKSVTALSSGDIVSNVDKVNTALQSNGIMDDCVNTGSRNCKSGFVWPSGDVLQHAEENQVFLTPPGEECLKHKADSMSILDEATITKDLSDYKLGSRVDKNASLRFRIVKDSNGCSVAVKGNSGISPISTNKEDFDSSDHLMENGNCDPKIVRLSEVDVDPNPIYESDHNLSTQISSLTDDTGDLEGNLSLVALNYLHKRGKNLADDLHSLLPEMGWKIRTYTDKQMIKRVQFVSPEGQSYYSLKQVCEFITDPKDYTRTQSYPAVNSNLMSSSIMSVDSSIQQGPLLDVLQQHCGRDGSSICKKALPLDPIRMETVANRSVSFCSEPLARGSSIMKGPLANAASAIFFEPEYCPDAVVELYGLGPLPNHTMHAKNLRAKAKRHLSFMGWGFKHVNKNEGREMRYTSPPPNSKDFNSLRTACKACIDRLLSEGTKPVEGTIKGENSKAEQSCVNLSSAIVCADVEEVPVSVYVQSGSSCTDISGSSLYSEFQLSNVDAIGQNRIPRRRKANDFALNLGGDVSGIGSDIRQYSMSLQGLTSCQNSNYPVQKKRKIARASMRKGDALDGSCPSRMLRSHKRARQVVAPNPAHYTPRTILTWLIDNNVVLPREKVFYRQNYQTDKEGKITRDGIKCNCCHKVFGISSFELHAKSTKRRPAANIFLEDGRSLLDCQKQILESGKLAGCPPVSYHGIKSTRRKAKNDSICSVCHYGGTLVLCDQCPSSYHLSCIGLESLPEGKWFCPSCQCGICGQSDYNGNVDQFTDKTVLHCDQCEREYHVGCLRNKRMAKLDGCPKGNWFCSKTCEKIFLGLYKLLGRSFPVGIDNLSWTILKFSENGSDKDAVTVHSKLNIALAVMHECFEPIKEPQTKDLVKDVLFNKRSVLKRLDFQGFYTVLLEREDELISVATVRVYGGKVAEVPLVGTRVQYRRQGMCRILMDLLEKKLAELGVHRLLLPAIPQVLHAWTTSFGFSKMTNSERLEYLEYTFLDFQDTTMCQKNLKVKVVREKQHFPKIDLNFTSADVSFDKGDPLEVVKKDEPSDALIQIPVKNVSCNDCSSSEAVSPVTKPSNGLWSEYENRTTESAGAQKEDNKWSKTYYRRRYKHQPQPKYYRQRYKHQPRPRSFITLSSNGTEQV